VPQFQAASFVVGKNINHQTKSAARQIEKSDRGWRMGPGDKHQPRRSTEGEWLSRSWPSVGKL